MSVTALRQLETKYLANDGKIDAKEAKKLLGKKSSTPERAFLREMLERDSFDPKARKLFESTLSKREPAPRRLGWVHTRHGVTLDMVAKKDLSPLGGFSQKYEALAAARAYDGTATVIEDKQGRWFAYGTNMPKNVLKESEVIGIAAPDDPNVRSAEHVNASSPPDYTAAAQKAYDLQAKHSKGDKSVTQADVDTALVEAAAMAAGVDPKDVRISKGPGDRVPGKINLEYKLGAAGTVGRNASNGSLTLLPKDKTTPAIPARLTMGIANLRTASPLAFQRTLAHEGVHLGHDKKADALLEQWRSSGSKKRFETWLASKRDAGAISHETFETTKGAIDNNTGPTELAAHTRAFLATFGSVPLDDISALKEAKGYLRDAFGYAASDALKKEMFEEMERSYLTWGPKHREAFDQLVTELPKELKGFRAN